jgi:DnaK suppressor protein
MSLNLTAEQLEALETELGQRRLQLERRLAELQDGASRTEHAAEVLRQDADDAPQRADAREVDFALSDLERQELGAVDDALARLRSGAGYGICTDCGAEIPYGRLRVEPEALRCIACATRREARAPR